MTREEAINYFKRSFAIGEGDDEKYHNEVLEYTIKALKQQDVPDINDGKLLEISTGSESEDKEEMNEQMVFPETFEKFAKEYGFYDKEEVYTNGSHLISVFRVNQWLEHVKQLEQQPCYNPDEWCHDCSEYNQDKHCCPRFNKVMRNTVEEIKEPKMGHWIVEKGNYLGMKNGYCSNCKNYYTNDWNEMKYCPNCGSRMVELQESVEK
jgi:hypothetical protein